MSKVLRYCINCHERLAQTNGGLCWECEKQKQEEVSSPPCTFCGREGVPTTAYGDKIICGRCLMSKKSYQKMYTIIREYLEINQCIDSPKLAGLLGKTSSHISGILGYLFRVNLIERKKQRVPGKSGFSYGYYDLKNPKWLQEIMDTTESAEDILTYDGDAEYYKKRYHESQNHMEKLTKELDNLKQVYGELIDSYDHVMNENNKLRSKIDEIIKPAVDYYIKNMVNNMDMSDLGLMVMNKMEAETQVGK